MVSDPGRLRAPSALLFGIATCLLAQGCGEDGPPSHEDAGGGATDAGAIEDAASDATERRCDRPGTFRGLTFDHGGERRAYFLHVPASHRCDAPIGLLVDFHGAYSGARPEEAYVSDDAVAVADEEGFILLRPRSLQAPSGTYMWNGNEGDIAKNLAFTKALIADLDARYGIDPRRLYATGYSSGSNMAAQFLGDAESPFAGIAMIAGGIFDPIAIPALGPTSPRVYLVTGYRDLHRPYADLTLDALRARGLPADRLWHRGADAGHAMRAWHLRELWAFFDRGERPTVADLAAGWSHVDVLDTDADLLEVAATVGQGVTITGARGALWHATSIAGPWAQPTSTPTAGWAGLCIAADGGGITVGEDLILRTVDAGETWLPLPRLAADPALGFIYVHAASCREGGFAFAAGYTGLDLQGASVGTTTHHFDALLDFQTEALSASAGPSGTTVAVGRFAYAGRRGAADPDFTALPLEIRSANEVWLSGVGAGPDGRWWIVGDGGRVFHSADDALSFDPQTTPSQRDLYAVDFWDGQIGMAVGAQGVALLTTDGGAHWTDISPGPSIYLGDVEWLDPRHALVVGEAGAALTFTR